MNWAAIFWLVLLIVFIAAEAATVTMVSAWFACGALTAMIISLLGGQVWLQTVLFFAVSALMLMLLRPVVRKHFTPKLTKTNVDSVVGAAGLVTQNIDNVTGTGQVKLGAMYWTARSTDNTPIAEGTQIKVDRIEGVKVLVSALEVPAQTK